MDRFSFNLSLRAGFLALVLLPAASFGQFTASTSGTNVSCNGAADGTATVTPSGGTGHYSYSWSNGATTSTINGLAPGTYTVTITDTVSAEPFALYSQDFDATHGWTLNVATGTQGADPNFWTVNDNEGGVPAGGCGVGGNANSTLHITSVFNPNGGASYDAGGLCGFLYCPQTASRAESPVFSTTNYSNLTLEFDFISVGDGTTDNASVWYNAGSGWAQLTASIKSGVCGGGQGLWTHYSQALPASCSNAASVQVAINWVNNDDGVGTDPSIAVNDVLVSGVAMVPVYETTTSTITITEPAAITGSSSTTSCGTYMWNGQAYASSGTYQQTLTAANGCDSTHTLNLTVNPLPTPTVTLSGVNNLQASNADGYQWINCADDSEINGATSQTYQAQQNGSYAVITTINGCSDTSGCVSVVSLSLSENESDGVSLHPVPAAELITISGTNAGETFVIHDLNGKLLIEGTCSPESTPIHLEALPKGSYIVSLRKESRTIQLRFVK